jgi:hypothetical protein
LEEKKIFKIASVFALAIFFVDRLLLPTHTTYLVPEKKGNLRRDRPAKGSSSSPIGSFMIIPVLQGRINTSLIIVLEPFKALVTGSFEFIQSVVFEFFDPAALKDWPWHQLLWGRLTWQVLSRGREPQIPHFPVRVHVPFFDMVYCRVVDVSVSCVCKMS